MSSLLGSKERTLAVLLLLALLVPPLESCSDKAPSASEDFTGSNGGTVASSAGGANPSNGGAVNTAAGGVHSSGASSTHSGGIASSGGSASRGGDANRGGEASGGVSGGVGGDATGGTNPVEAGAGGGTGAAGGSTAAGASGYVVALVQSTQSRAEDITQEDVKSMVSDAVTQAGGLDFITDGMTVVLKPNLLTHLANCWSGTALLPQTANGVSTDWRITKAVADLVRAKNPTGKILVMEGSNRNTSAAFNALGYTTANFGSSVDEFIALEGTGCSSRSQSGLVQKAGRSGARYWVNQRYLDADIVISLGALKSHGSAGITGCVKNVGIGATPNSVYSLSTNDADCTRNYNQSGVSSYIDHTFNGLGEFISDYYSIKPVDFAIMDGLQGLQNGPCSTKAEDRKNMRLILASRNAVALDTVQAAVMTCVGTKVPYLTRLESWGFGSTDLTKIRIAGNRQIADVKQRFSGAAGGVCD